MPSLDDLSPELQAIIWTLVAEDDCVIIMSKKIRGTPNIEPSLCSRTSAQAYSTESAKIIKGILFQRALKRRCEIRANILNFDFNNLIRFFKYVMATPADCNAPRGDISLFGIEGSDGEKEATIECAHIVTSSLEYQPTKLTTWLKFSTALYKKTQLQIGAFHVLRSVEESPAIWDLSSSYEREVVNSGDGSQPWLVSLGLKNWRIEMTWVMRWGQKFLDDMKDQQRKDQQEKQRRDEQEKLQQQAGEE